MSVEVVHVGADDAAAVAFPGVARLRAVKTPVEKVEGLVGKLDLAVLALITGVFLTVGVVSYCVGMS